MTMPNSIIFEQLQNAKIKTIDGPRWMASDLVNIFNLKWNFHLIPNTNIRILLSDNHQYLDHFVSSINARRPNKISNDIVLNQIINDHTKTITHDFTMDAHDGTTTKHLANTNAMLTNFAAWTLLNPNEPINGGLFGRIYFMNLGDTYQDMDTQYDKLARIFMRRYLTTCEKRVSGILNRYNINFREFAMMAHRVFYNNINTETLKNTHNIPMLKSDPIANYMGYKSLRAKFDAYTGAIDKLNRTNSSNPGTMFIDTAMQNLYNERRKMFQTYHITPEQDLYKLSVGRLTTQRTHEAVDFIAQHIKIKSR